jgi:DNA-binding MarR family transcriptional regulator
MERLYNPDLMPKEEIKATFVARQGLIDEIVSVIKRQPDGAGAQHLVIIAPRGMGKTTVLLMVRFAIQDSELAEQWQAVQFPEERYNIYDLADFWMEILSHLDEATGDSDPQRRAEDLKREYPKNDDLQEAALALIKDWSRKHGKRIVVLVDNFDMILEQINDERDNARLRDVLMNDGTMMLIGGATTFFHEVRAYDQPLYNFFKIYELHNLSFAQMQDLLRRRAALDKREDFEETLKANASRLRVLEHFTGGNPRLVLMLYRVVTQSDISEVRLGLEKLLDEVTPYYKSKVESLPPQQRKILDHIARVSSQTNEGLTPTEIAAATRMTPNQASTQLKRLSENGYVRAANVRGRSSYYTLSERLYAIWHQMRFGRNARERMGWLVNILKALYDAEEMGAQSVMLEKRFRTHLIAGRMIQARQSLEHHFYISEAMDNAASKLRELDKVIRGYIKLKDIETIKKEVLPSIDLNSLPVETLIKLNEIGCIDHDKFSAHNLSNAVSLLEQENKSLKAALENVEHCISAFSSGRFDKALKFIDKALTYKPNEVYYLLFRGFILIELQQGKEAIKTYRQGLSLLKENPELLQDEATLGLVSSVLLFLTLNDGEFTRKLMEEIGLTERFFPLARAIDYVQTRDDALLEKLSPEVRGVVEEIVAMLIQSVKQMDKPKNALRIKKPKSGSHHRARKQLR